MGGVTVDNIATYNGQTFDNMNGGISAAVYVVGINRDNIVYAGTSSAAGYVQAYNGSTWYDVDLKTHGQVQAIAFNGLDAYYGAEGTGTSYYSGDTTITAVGAAYFNPIFTIKREGGTSATLKYIQNVNRNKEMYFNLAIFDGETITIDTVARTITSNYGRVIRRDAPSGPGPGRGVTGNPLPGSMLGTFALGSGENIINLWVDTVGSPTITAIMSYVARYDGVGGAEVA